MELFPLHTPIIRAGDDLAQILVTTIRNMGLSLQHHDILVIAETVVATAQGRIRNLEGVKVSPEAQELASLHELEPALAQLILEESEEILGGIPHVLLTIKHDTLMANAGIDRSNAPLGHVVLLPSNPPKEAWRIKQRLESMANCELGIIIADSRTQPLRLGTIGVALAVAGFEPVKDFRGKPDIYGRQLRITRAAIADDLASAAQLVMGEANEQIPAVLIRGAPVRFTKKQIKPDSLAISREECLYFAIFEDWYRKSRASEIKTHREK